MKKIFILLAAVFVFSSAVYSQKPTPEPTAEPFLMEILDVFSVAGAGMVVTGTVERGKINVGDEVEIVGKNETRKTTVVQIIKPPIRERQAEANKGDSINIILKGVTKDDLSRGQVIAKPGSIRAYTKFKTKIDMLSVLAGGKKTPMSNGYRPMVMVRNDLLSGTVSLPHGTGGIAAGTKNVEIEIEIATSAPLEIGQEIKLREGSRIIAVGTITGFPVSK